VGILSLLWCYAILVLSIGVDFIIGSWEIWKLSLVVRLRMDGGPDVEARLGRLVVNGQPGLVGIANWESPCGKGRVECIDIYG